MTNVLITNLINFFFISKIRLTFASVRRHSSIPDVWGVCGLTKVRWTFCTHRSWSPPSHCQNKRESVELSSKFVYTGYFIYKSATSTYQQEFGSQAAPTWVQFSGAIGLDLSSQSGPRLEEWSCSSPLAGSWCCLEKPTKKWQQTLICL